MGTIRTVTGDIDATQLGSTNSHEHVFIRSGLILIREPDFRLDSVEKAISEVGSYAAGGGQALIDTSPLSVGRFPEGLRAVSQATKVHVVASTGFHKTRYYLDTHWRFHYTVEEIAKLLIQEIVEGMDAYGFEGPLPRPTGIRAGLVKVASEYQRIEPAVRVAMEAAGLAHQATGVPVLTHTEMGTMASEQLELLRNAGVPSQHVVLSHMDRNPDLGLHLELASTGAFLEYDGPGRVKYFPESTLISLIRGMFDRGAGGHVLLGGDTARRSYWKAYDGGPGMDYTVRMFVPRLLREGFTQEEIDQIFIHNPAAAFALAERSASA